MENIILKFLLLISFSVISQTKHTAYCIKQPHDGDSVKLLIDVGLDVYLEKDCRIMGIDAPEINTKNILEKFAGIKVQQVLSKLIFQKEFIIYVFEDINEKFGRTLIEIEIENICVNNYLIKNNLAKIYSGNKKTEWINSELNAIINFK